MARVRQPSAPPTSSPQALPNPIGYPKPANTELVRVGTGEMVHVYSPSTKDILCQSGKNAGRRNPDGTQNRKKKEFFKSDATQVTCYRCSKLLSMNHNGT
jgi:hypothetical protein